MRITTQRLDTLYVVTASAVAVTLMLAIGFIARTGLPSADVVAQQAANRPVLNVSDFSPGDVEILMLNAQRVVVWRRNDAELARAARQNTPAEWRYQTSQVLGQGQPVFADDANLTMEAEWFFASAEFSNPYQYVMPRSGDFGGFFEGRYALHFDLEGRLRKGGGPANLTVIEADYVDGGQGIRLYLEGKP